LGHEFLAGFIGMEAVLSKVVAAETVVLSTRMTGEYCWFFPPKGRRSIDEFQQGILLIGLYAPGMI